MVLAAHPRAHRLVEALKRRRRDEAAPPPGSRGLPGLRLAPRRRPRGGNGLGRPPARGRPPGHPVPRRPPDDRVDTLFLTGAVCLVDESARRDLVPGGTPPPRPDSRAGAPPDGIARVRVVAALRFLTGPIGDVPERRPDPGRGAVTWPASAAASGPPPFASGSPGPARPPRRLASAPPPPLARGVRRAFSVGRRPPGRRGLGAASVAGKRASRPPFRAPRGKRRESWTWRCVGVGRPRPDTRSLLAFQLPVP